ncbi:MAG: GNAT family N-acetyltransferase [Acidobacteriia bacterium]|nr:GNAT family N-acetyltransferase [Terriglobia bacterium]
MTTGLEIRPAAEADVAAIVALIRALAEYEKAAPGAVSLTDELLREALFGARPALEALVATVAGEIGGYALFFHNFSSWRGRRGLYLEDLFVRPELRGRGIGQALFAELTRLARERSCARIEWVVVDWNSPAIGFYQSQGAAPIEGWTLWRADVPPA